MLGNTCTKCPLRNGHGNPDDDSVVIRSIGELESDLVNTKDQLSRDHQVPQGMHPFDTAAFEDCTRSIKPVFREYLGKLTTIIERVKSKCYNYLVQVELILSEQEKQTKAFDGAIVDVLGYFKSTDRSVYDKLIKVGQLAVESDGESRSLLLTEVRRAYKGAVDHFYPPTDEPVLCVDGKKRDLGEDRYLNRAREYVRSNASN